MCNVVYKIVAKVLASRIKILLPGLISPNQSSFVPRRQIFDNVLVAFKSFYSIARKKVGKRGLTALKLDMSKAYGRVEWNFIRVIMLKMSFPTAWVDLVMDCVSLTSLSFVLNGRNVGSVVPSRGLRQGCQLVADLIDSVLRRWDIRKIDEVLWPIDKESVLSISLSRRNINDFLLWHLEKSGIYTVHSSYRVASSTSSKSSASNS
ncbi:hypothetical protein Ddye_029498 [Dipteronia dyeriana]|uniref:Reverse transcriptase domain-containing protein n=1 Tax=Dipteronia dyeriana TaxID=168575 RepID=A0AAD9TEP6_9ROSI|nr:hypothetical protein Ddye_029494 [Dipteronia dyeriana]KAK2634706.1 hypothetical protein Ddye_029498 [Dipteronia dyeriana]